MHYAVARVRCIDISVNERLAAIACSNRQRTAQPNETRQRAESLQTARSLERP